MYFLPVAVQFSGGDCEGIRGEIKSALSIDMFFFPGEYLGRGLPIKSPQDNCV